MSDNHLLEQRLCLLGNGFIPLPVLSHTYPGDGAGKGVHLDAWTDIDITSDAVRGWGYGKRRNDSNTGIRCGEVVGLDIDVYDPALADRLRKLALAHFGGEPPIRIGQPPKCLMLYRTAVPRTKRVTGKYALPGYGDEKGSRVEVLGKGQQLVGFGIHPVTLKPFEWIGPSPLEIKVSELPLVDNDAVDEFLDMAEQMIINAGGILETESQRHDPEPRERTTSAAAADPSARDEIDDALRSCPNNSSYEEWAKIGAGIYNTLGEAGQSIWLDWSGKYHDYVEADARSKWQSFSRSPMPSVGKSTIFKFAYDYGWKSAAMLKKEERERQRAQELQEAERMWAPPPDQIDDVDPSQAPDWPSEIQPPTQSHADHPSQRARSDEPEPEAPKAKSEKAKTTPPPKAKKQGDNDPFVTEGIVAVSFADQYRDRLRYSHSDGSWYLWDGVRWRKEGTKLAFHFAHMKSKSMGDYSSSAKTAGKAAFASGVERIAQSNPDLSITQEQLDSDPWLLGTPGGTIDLKTGKLRPQKQDDYITKLVAVTPLETAECPTWLKFIKEATRHDPGYARLLQQWFGYSLTGVTREHALLFVYGEGGNGKSVFLNVISGIMADYARTATMDTFISSKNERHLTELAHLAGARFVCASETEEGKYWSEVRLKQLTGGDKIAARFMRQDLFEFTPQFKLTIIGNHVPLLNNANDAMRRRFRLAPFDHKPAVPDKDLESKLQEEWPGILRWAIDGCLDWQQHQLVWPAAVSTATADYFSEQDNIGQWLDECCIRKLDNGKDTVDSFKNLMASWSAWARSREEQPGSAKRFSGRMRSHGLMPFADEFDIAGKGFKGAKVKPRAPRG